MQENIELLRNTNRNNIIYALFVFLLGNNHMMLVLNRKLIEYLSIDEKNHIANLPKVLYPLRDCCDWLTMTFSLERMWTNS